MPNSMSTFNILIVEDSPIQAEMLRRFLVSNNLTCVVATDGEAGLLAIKTAKPDLIISDVQMPVLDGYEMCERIKADSDIHNVPIILLTALSDPIDVIRGLNAGAQAYLTKPYDNERLLVQIRRLLNTPPQESNLDEEMPLDVEINQTHYSVHAGREQILQMLVSTYDNAAYQNQLLRKLEEDLNTLNQHLEIKVAERTALLTEQEKKARNAEARYRTLFALLPEGAGLITTDQWKFVEFNDVACGQLGYLRPEFEKLSFLDLIAPDEKSVVSEHLKQALTYPQSTFTTKLISRDGLTIDADIRTRQIEIEGQLLLNCILRDISDITHARQMERDVQHNATHDLTTDLPSQTLLIETLVQAIHLAKKKNSVITLFAIDLSRLSTIAASLGHSAVEAVQVEFADRLRSLQPKASIVARINNSNFILMVDGSFDPSPLTELLTRISRATNTPYLWNNSSLELEPYMGVSMYPKDAQDAESLLQAAEAALFEAKKSARKSIVLASPELNEQVQNMVRKENELRNAFSNGWMEMFYQPRVDLKTGKISGAEALIRCRDPEKGIIPPKDFIPLAEEIGLIGPITIWALDQVCQQQKKWQDAGIQIVPVSVNLVAEQFQDDHIITVLKQNLEKYQLSSQYLEVELTESAAMQHPEKTADLLNQIQALGILIAIDDFGTGYSSLAYLEKFPINILKIDISFVQGVTTDPHSAAITSAIIAMSKALQFLIVAEGVETEGQRLFLSEHHCEEGQGFLFSKPLPANDFESLLAGDIRY